MDRVLAWLKWKRSNCIPSLAIEEKKITTGTQSLSGKIELRSNVMSQWPLSFLSRTDDCHSGVVFRAWLWRKMMSTFGTWSQAKENIVNIIPVTTFITQHYWPWWQMSNSVHYLAVGEEEHNWYLLQVWGKELKQEWQKGKSRHLFLSFLPIKVNVQTLEKKCNSISSERVVLLF